MDVVLRFAVFVLLQLNLLIKLFYRRHELTANILEDAFATIDFWPYGLQSYGVTWKADITVITLAIALFIGDLFS
jgi:hypothetical protein